MIGFITRVKFFYMLVLYKIVLRNLETYDF